MKPRSTSTHFRAYTFHIGNRFCEKVSRFNSQLLFLSCFKLLSIILLLGLVTEKSFGQWTKSEPLEGTMDDMLFVSATQAFVGTGGHIYRTSDTGESWGLTPYFIENQDTNSAYFLIQFMGHHNLGFVSPNVGYSVGVNAFQNSEMIIKTIDGGDTWQIQHNENAIDAIFQSFQVALTDLSVISESKVVVVGNHGRILRTIDGGANWVAFQHEDKGIFNSVFFINESKGFIGGLNTWLITEDGGGTWETIETPYNIQDVYFSNELEGVAVTEKGEILKTEDAGRSWTAYGYQSNDRLTKVEFISQETGFILGDTDLLKTEDGGETWYLIARPEGQELFGSFSFYDENQGFLGSYLQYGQEGPESYVYHTTNGGEFEAQEPVIDSVSPETFGSLQNITVSGTNLTHVTAVKWGDISLRYSILQDSTLSIAIPTGITQDRLSFEWRGGTVDFEGDYFFSNKPRVNELPENQWVNLGDSLRFTGENLDSVSFAKLAGSIPLPHKVQSKTKLSLFIPENASPGESKIQFFDHFGRLIPDESQVLVIGRPKILALSAFNETRSVQAGAGVAVTVEGESLLNTTGVRFGDTEVPFTVVSNRRVAFQIPDEAVTSHIFLTTETGIAKSPYRLKILEKQSIESLSHRSAAIGDLITIKGHNFYTEGDVFVRVGEESAITPQVLDEETITFVYAGGSGKVSVGNQAGTVYSEEELTHNGEQAYIVSYVEPQALSPGVRVVLRGNWPSYINSVTYADVQVDDEVSGTNYTFFNMPEERLEGVTKSVFKFYRGNDLFLTSDSVIYVSNSRPVVFSVSPNQGQIGQKVDLAGINLQQIDSILIGDKKGLFTVQSSTEAGFWIPEGASSGDLFFYSALGNSKLENFRIKPANALAAEIQGIYTSSSGGSVSKLLEKNEYVVVGTNLLNPDSLAIHDLKITAFEVISDKMIRFEAPPTDSELAGIALYAFFGDHVAHYGTRLLPVSDDPIVAHISPLEGPRGTLIDIDISPDLVRPNHSSGVQGAYVNGLKTSLYTSTDPGFESKFKVLVPARGDVNGKIEYFYQNRIADTGSEFTLTNDEYCKFMIPETSEFFIPSYGIAKVVFNEISNESSEDEAIYNDYSDLNTEVNVGQAYTLTVDSRYFKVFIDWNGDKIFDENTETVMVSEDPGSKVIKVPLDAAVGKAVRMRVLRSKSFSLDNLSPCNSALSDFAEVEDYTINISESTGNTLDDFFPKEASVGAVILVNGSGFSALLNATVGGVDATFEVLNDKLLELSVPESAATGKIEFTFNTGTIHGQSNLEIKDDFGIPGIIEVKEGLITLIPGFVFHKDEVFNIEIGGVSVSFSDFSHNTLSYFEDGQITSGKLCIYGKGGKQCTAEPLKFPLDRFSFFPLEGKVGDSIRLSVRGNASSLLELKIGEVEAPFQIEDERNIIFQIPEGAQTAKVSTLNSDGLSISGAPLTVITDYCQPVIRLAGNRITRLQIGSIELFEEDLKDGYNDLRHLVTNIDFTSDLTVDADLGMFTAFNVFVDWNRDLNFTGFGAVSYNRLGKPPLGVEPGVYAMRVVVYNSSDRPNPCDATHVYDLSIRVIDVLGIDGDGAEFEADFISSATEIAEGGSVNFTDKSIGQSDSWEWHFEGAETSVSYEQNPQGIQYLNPGSYEVSLTVRQGSSTINTKRSVGYIRVEPKLNVGFEASATQLVAGDAINFMDTTIGNINQWEWTFEGADVTTSNEKNPEGITYSTPGVFGVTLAVSSDSQQGSQTTSGYINVYPEMIADFSSIEREAVVGIPLQFNDESEGNPDQWQWSVEGATPEVYDEANPQVSFSQAGVFDVVLKVSGNIQESIKSEEDYITVYERLVSDFEADATQIEEGGEINFTDLSLGNPESREWEFEGAETSSSVERNPSGIVYPNSGVYRVSLTIRGNIQEDTKVSEAYITVNLVTGIENGLGNGLKIYPNPVNDIVYIDALNMPLIQRYSISNMTGLQLGQGEVREGQINVRHLPSGIYLVKLVGDGKTLTLRFVKK